MEYNAFLMCFNILLQHTTMKKRLHSRPPPWNSLIRIRWYLWVKLQLTTIA